MKPTITRAVAYLRVSTEKQADFGVSLDAQKAKVRAFGELYDTEIVEVVVDAGASAKTLDRPGLQRALAMLKAGTADALLVVKLDRLTRSVVDLGALVDRYFGPGSKWSLLSVSEQIDTRTSAGRLVLNVLTSVSQWEREAIAARTSAAMQHKVKAGEYTGGAAPYGYRLGEAGTLDPVPEEQRVIAAALAHRAAVESTTGKAASLRAVAAHLTSLGYTTREDKPFAAAQVQRMVARATRCPHPEGGAVAESADERGPQPTLTP